MQSKIKSSVPKIVAGIQETWESDKGKFFKYLTVFENGDTGTSMGKNPEPPYIIDGVTEYIYDKKVNGQHVSFSGIKKVEAPHVQGQANSDGGSYWNKPRVLHYKMKTNCYECAISYFMKLPAPTLAGFTREVLLGHIDTLATELFNFVMILNDEQQRWSRVALIKLAVDNAITIQPLVINKAEGIKSFVVEAEKCINANAPA